ncbi:MAG: prolipoprotein diacylglyceryl transferase [Candidatus Scalindua sp.]|nr:prolipoprotein diacylglyceryl transferase [Candidatus Scalindua sp.]
MLRTLFQIPIPFIGKTIPVYAYGFMLMIGFLAALYAARMRAKREGIKPEHISDLGIYLIFAGIAGGRLFYVVQNFDLYRDNLVDILKIYHGGLVFYGGLLAATITLIVIVRLRKLPLLLTFDIIAPSIAMGLFFGRIGCFLNGCCWGDICDPDLWWAVSFPKSVDVNNMIDGSPAFVDHLEKGLITISDGYSLPVHPTQIYSSLGNLAIFFMANAFFKYRKRDGEILIIFCMLYSVLRFCMEILRDDNPPLFDGLTISQNISALVFVVTVTLFFIGRVKRKGRGRNFGGTKS